MADLTWVSPGKIGTRTGLAPSGGRRESVFLPLPEAWAGAFHVEGQLHACPAPSPKPQSTLRPVPMQIPDRAQQQSWSAHSQRCRAPGRGGAGGAGDQDPSATDAGCTLGAPGLHGGVATAKEPALYAGKLKGGRAEDAGLRSIPPGGERAPPTAGSGLPALPTHDWSGSRHVTAARPIRFSPRFHPSVTGLVGTQEPHRRGAPGQPERRKGVTAWKTGTIVVIT